MRAVAGIWNEPGHRGEIGPLRTLGGMISLPRLFGKFGKCDEGADWVVVDLHGSFPSRRPQNPLEAIRQRNDTLAALTQRLERIGESSYSAVFVTTGGYTGGPATTWAISRLLGDLAKKKRVVAYLPDVTMFQLALTSQVAEVIAPESASVNIHGFAVEQLYLGGLLKKHGIGFENLRIKEYKSALTPFSEDAMDDYQREQMQAYLDAVEQTWVADLAKARELSVDAVRGVLDSPPVSAADLHRAGLITRVAYDDEILTITEPDFGSGLDLVMPQRPKKGAHVAVVQVHGGIVTGRSRYSPSPLFGGATAGSDTVVAALRKADRDPDVRAIVLHVDSGGGSALASDLIDREVRRASKPVVAVMGEVAASGGYYVAAHATKILASPYTITGSIGVVAGKAVLAELQERHGINPERVGRDEALIFSSSREFSDSERAWLTAMIDDVYDRFLDRVADGRGLTKERVNELGRGRIWAGTEAKDNGLIDDLGDLEAGIALARELGGLAEDAPAQVVSPGKLAGLLPEQGRSVSLSSLAWPLGRERVLTWLPARVTLH